MMNSIFNGLITLSLGAILFVFSLGTNAASLSKNPPTWGMHGMAVFGGADGLYASHLPMFHAPHDYQVVLSFKLADAKLDAQLRQKLAAKPSLWTLAPEKFELARLAPNAAQPLTQFVADIVEGHFERDGKTIYKSVVLDVVSTILYTQLNATAAHAKELRYQAIGQGKTWFLLKEITARPDFDHIIAIAATTAPPALKMPANGVSPPSDAALQALLPVTMRVLNTIYYDIEDLK